MVLGNLDKAFNSLHDSVKADCLVSLVSKTLLPVCVQHGRSVTFSMPLSIYGALCSKPQGQIVGKVNKWSVCGRKGVCKWLVSSRYVVGSWSLSGRCAVGKGSVNGW